MLQTLFHIPHQWLGITVFGFGWLLMVWAVFSVVVLARSLRHASGDGDTRSTALVLLVLGAAIAFVLPRLEDGLRGLPIRGYGSMVLLGAVLSVVLAAYRARRMAFDPEHILSLAFWMLVAGIAGARIFYVAGNWDEFRADSLRETVVEVLSFTNGGLVVYGSVIGGVLAAVLYLVRNRLPLLATGDLIAPSMLVGLAIGRIGCLLNGCCWGGECPADFALALRFPPGSPPYMRQLQNGELLGLRLQPTRVNGTRVVESVDTGSPAAQLGIPSGEQIESIQTAAPDVLREAAGDKDFPEPLIWIKTHDRQEHRISAAQVPGHSLPLYPAQIFSAINAGLIGLFLLAYYPFRRRDGEVFAWMITIYPVTRIVLEFIRDDEPGVFGTPFTPSQVVSGLVLLSAVGFWWYVERQPRGSVLPVSQPGRAPPRQIEPRAAGIA